MKTVLSLIFLFACFIVQAQKIESAKGYKLRYNCAKDNNTINVSDLNSCNGFKIIGSEIPNDFSFYTIEVTVKKEKSAYIETLKNITLDADISLLKDLRPGYIIYLDNIIVKQASTKRFFKLEPYKLTVK